MINNFDNSSSGVNLDLTLIRDENLSHFDYEDNFETLIQSALLFYTDFRQKECPVYISDIFNFKNLSKGVLWDMYESLGLGYDSTITKKEIVDDLSVLSISCLSKRDFDYVLKNAPLKKGLKIVGCFGYSQGDYIRVLCDESDDRALFEKIIYDCPITAILSIDDDEFYFNYYMKDSYNYDKTELMQIASEKIQHAKKDYIMAWLDENLPSFL